MARCSSPKTKTPDARNRDLDREDDVNVIDAAGAARGRRTRLMAVRCDFVRREILLKRILGASVT